MAEFNIDFLTQQIQEQMQQVDRAARADAVFRLALFFRSMACPKCEKAGRALRGSRHIDCGPWMRVHSMLLEPWMVSEIASGKVVRGDGDTFNIANVTKNVTIDTPDATK
jgi:hypothetical protein